MKTPENPHGIKAIAERLVLLRESMGMAQTEFAARAGIHQSIYNVYESGRRRPSLNDAIKLRQRLGVSMEWLYFGDELSMPDRLIGPLRRAEAERQARSLSEQSS
jgi:transcriptional regulator with XRE-family HTH domain